MTRQDRTVVFVRHGETGWNRAGRVQGWASVGLTDRGHSQARALGARLGTDYEVERIVSSDLRRARETAVSLAEHVAVTPQYSECWRERDFGVYQGLSQEALFGTYPEFRATEGTMGVRATPEGGESLLDLRERVLAGWETLLETNDVGDTVVVTHGGPLYTLFGHLKGLALPTAFTTLSYDNCALTEVRVTPDGSIHVVRENDLSHCENCE